MNIFTVLLIQPLANGLIVFYRIFGSNMGLAIIGFSVFLRFILRPLTKPYMDSMKKIRELSPQIEKLKKKHGGDKMKFAQAQAELYKQRGINPGSGCIPYLLQIVVLIAFFNVFSSTLAPNVDATKKMNELLYQPLKFQQEEKLNSSFLYLNITKPDTIKLPGVSTNLPGPILILAALVQFLSAKVMTPYIKKEEVVVKKTPESSDDFQVAMQKSMSYTFPLFTLLIGLKLASGLALYWLTFSAFQMLEQVKTQGWGDLTPWLIKLKLLKSDSIS